MVFDDAGQLRPRVAEGHSGTPEEGRRRAQVFRAVCPGVSVTKPDADGRTVHPVLGPYVSAHRGWAADEQIRARGSSGGVLTALAEWLVRTGRAGSARAAAADPARPSRTVPVRITSREEALAAAGSRYAPVSTLTDPPGRGGFADDVHVGRPCESDALGRWCSLSAPAPEGEEPLRLSFFCAGLPSQHATDRLVETLGLSAPELISLRYRGDGWPGAFTVQDASGRWASLDYETSWGRHLGRDIQDRCKVCPDGTGMHADVVVGDFWATDAMGYPVFVDGAGQSVVLARTPRGHRTLLAAAEAGVVELRDVDLDEVAAVQPLQTTRGRTLAGRLLGRVLAGRRVPRLRGYGLLHSFVRRPVTMLRVARGTRARLRRAVAGR